MGIKDLSNRVKRMERQFIVQPQQAVPDSHVALARELNLARMILTAEREAKRLIEQLENTGQIAGKESPAQRKANRAAGILQREEEVKELERRCAAVGLTEEDIARLAGTGG